MTNNKSNLINGKWFLPVVFLIGGLLIGWMIFSGGDVDDHSDHDLVATADEVWTCSMHPSVRSESPGTCPICAMDLIPASRSGDDESVYEMVMSENAVRLAEIQTVAAERRITDYQITATGTLQPDERLLANVAANFRGRITQLHVDYTGANVRKDQPLFSIYSDELISAQRELIEAVKVRGINPLLYRAARQKLFFWDLREHQVDAIEQRSEPMRQVDILSPAAGTVIARNVSLNDQVNTGDVLYQIADLSRLWVMLDVFESDINRLKPDDTIQFSIQALPGRSFDGKITWISPVLDPVKRTVQVRAEVNNRDGQLRPGMLLSGRVDAGGTEAIVVPASAVLWTGPRSLVYVRDMNADSPRFESREVTLGHRTGDFYVIEEGIEPGEHVVFHGAFKLDSEFQLMDKFSMMNREPGLGAMPAGHQHGTEIEDHRSNVDSSFRGEFTEFIQLYLSLKEELVDSDMNGALEQATLMSSKLSSIGEHRLQGEAHAAWMAMYGNLRGHLNPISEAGDLEAIRSEFRFLSDMIVDATKSFGIEGVVYRQYCPMAFDFDGAYWLSNEEEIANPYLPETMLRCGEVVESIEQ
jgi:Cu(I)/Ag(I) efflux system membrane fusion protein